MITKKFKYNGRYYYRLFTYDGLFIKTVKELPK